VARLVPTEVPAEVPGTSLQGDAAFLGAVHTVPVGKVRMAFRRFGSGPDLVLVAGEGSGMGDWPLSVLAALAKEHMVTIYDNRDLGLTSRTATGFTLDDLADDLAGLINALGMHRPAVFGWSTGGEIGLLLAVRHPEVVSSLAISGATAGGSLTVPSTPEIEACMREEPPTCDLLSMLFSTDAEGAAAKTAFVADYVKVPHPDDAPHAMAKYVAAEDHYNAGAPVDFAKVTVPVLVTNGDVDPLVPVRNAHVIAGQLGPRATLLIDHGGAHAWFVQHLDRFLVALESFLARPG
jgi:pimeloyl-ACP methyl ester carboxylesterase